MVASNQRLKLRTGLEPVVLKSETLTNVLSVYTENILFAVRVFAIDDLIKQMKHFLGGKMISLKCLETSLEGIFHHIFTNEDVSDHLFDFTFILFNSIV